MPKFEDYTLFYVLAIIAGLFLLWLGYRIGNMVSRVRASRAMAAKEDELFSAQRSFKTVYEQELNGLKARNQELEQRIAELQAKVDEYRKKAAGYGGLFSSNKRADAMYALLLENEALEEALYTQNEKLRQERTDALKEQLRATGYRRALITQLLNDDRIKGYVSEVLADERRLPAPQHAQQDPQS